MVGKVVLGFFSELIKTYRVGVPDTRFMPKRPFIWEGKD